MTTRASRFPECRILNFEWKRKQRAIENSEKLSKILMQENEERMSMYARRFMETNNYDKYKQDMDRQTEFMKRRVLDVLW